VVDFMDESTANVGIAIVKKGNSLFAVAQGTP